MVIAEYEIESACFDENRMYFLRFVDIKGEVFYMDKNKNLTPDPEAKAYVSSVEKALQLIGYAYENSKRR